jgi:hypothetical protein
MTLSQLNRASNEAITSANRGLPLTKIALTKVQRPA